MKRLLDIFIRYLIIILFSLNGLFIFYFIFTPLTFTLVYLVSNLFFEVVKTSSTSILVNGFEVSLIPACVAGAGYYLLLLLNLSIPNITLTKRLKVLAFSFGLFLSVNVLRILILIVLLANNSIYFDITHKFFWYFLSTIFILLIWFLEIKIFKIKSIPFYEDLLYFYRQSVFKK